MRILLGVLGVAFSLVSFAHEDEGHGPTGFVDWFIHIDGLAVALWSILPLTLLILTAVKVQESSELAKKIVFWSITAVAGGVTLLFLAQTTVKNVVSETKGPVHWHADFEIYICGEQIDMIDPTGMLNRVGTSLLHEHGDNRIHAEGTLIKKSDASLGRFFEVVGGELTVDSLKIPTNDSMADTKTADCDGVLNVYVYKTVDWVAKQEKLSDPAAYIPSPITAVPPADCIIFEFGPEKDKTEKLCTQYKVKRDKGDLTISE